MTRPVAQSARLRCQRLVILFSGVPVVTVRLVRFRRWRWLLPRRPVCWVRGHRWAAHQVEAHRVLVVCGWCLAGAEGVPLVPLPARALPVGVDPVLTAFALTTSMAQGHPSVVRLAEEAAGDPLVTLQLAYLLARSTQEASSAGRDALAELSLRVQLERMGEP